LKLVPIDSERQIGKKKNNRMLKKAVQPYFAKASSRQAKARGSEAPGAYPVREEAQRLSENAAGGPVSASCQ